MSNFVSVGMMLERMSIGKQLILFLRPSCPCGAPFEETWPRDSATMKQGVGNKPKKSWLYRLTSSQWDSPKRTTATRTNQTLSFGKCEHEPQEGIHDFPRGPVVKSPPADAGDVVQSPVWEDPTCSGATKPVHLGYWARGLHLPKPTRLEPMLGNKRSQCSEKPVRRHQRVASSWHS